MLILISKHCSYPSFTNGDPSTTIFTGTVQYTEYTPQTMSFDLPSSTDFVDSTTFDQKPSVVVSGAPQVPQSSTNSNNNNNNNNTSSTTDSSTSTMSPDTNGLGSPPAIAHTTTSVTLTYNNLHLGKMIV